MTKIAEELEEALRLVRDGFASLGLASHIDDVVLGLTGAGEYELAYSALCVNIYEYEVPVSQEAYNLMVKIWSEMGRDVQKMEGADWHFTTYLGVREGSTLEGVEPGSLVQIVEPKKEHIETPGKYPWNSDPVGVDKPGNLEFHPKWDFSEKTTEAVRRLIQLGVTIYSVRDGADITFMVPHGLYNEQYVEVEKLTQAIAQDMKSEVSYIDWYPHGHKLRIKI